MASLEERLKAHAIQLGFDLAGIAPAAPADGFEHLTAWLSQGYAGDMGYMERHAEARRHPQSILPEVRSVIMLARSYKPASPDPGPQPRKGRVARYARGPDYHQDLRLRLKSLLQWLQGERPECRGRAVVDTAPLLERDFARRAGLGWIAKNTMLINPRLGSYTYLAALLVDLSLESDRAFERMHCGTCTACLSACPTGAFPAAGWLDSRRCLSYLTIELRGEIPLEHRENLGDWLFGCDICQEVCPWNRKAVPASGGHGTDLAALDPIEILRMTRNEFQTRFGSTALERTGWEGLRRNAALVLGNVGDDSALAPLRALATDSSQVLQNAAAWAIQQITARQS